MPCRRHRRAYWAEPLERRVLLATMSGTVYNDTSADGNRTPFLDPGLGGWTVYVDANENGAFDAGEPNDASAAGGAWSITSAGFRPRDTYHVRIVNQSTWRPTEPVAGEYAVSFDTTSETVANLEFGQTRRALVQGTVFHDTNEDGTWDREPVLSGRTVFADANNNGILDAGEVSAVTNSNGDYALSPAAGTYTIRQVQQAGWWQTAPSPPSAGHVVTLSNGQSVSGRHFGNVVATVDLVGAGFAITSAFDPVPADGRIDVLYQIRNNGTADSPGFRARFYLSNDATITTADILLRDIAQGSIPRHATVDRTTPITLPSPDPLRTDNQYYVGMIVDSDGDVAETNESNNANQGVLADRYPVSSEADLPAPVDNANVLATPITIPGQAAGVIGDEWIGGYDQDIYRLDVTAGHNLRLAVGGLSPGMMRLFDSDWSQLKLAVETIEYTVPDTDTYYIVVSSGGNGLNDPRRISGRAQGPTGAYTLTVGTFNNADLGDSSISVQGSVPGPFHATIEINTNVNPFNTHLLRDFDVTVYLSDDRVITPQDVFLAKTRVTMENWSAAGAASPGWFETTADFTVPPIDPFRTDNQYFIGILADTAGELAEQNETNNSATSFERYVSEADADSPVDPQFARGPLVDPGQSFSRAIGDEWIGPYDLDAVFVRINAGETIQFDVDRTGTTLDAYVRLYDNAWNLLAANDNGAAPAEAAGADPFLRHTFAAAGTYWVVVGGAGNHDSDPRLLAGRTAASTGAYTIAVTSEPAGPVTGGLFDDRDNDGTRDDAEQGLAGWTVFLDARRDGHLSAGDPTAPTGPDGTFTFTGVRPGTYDLRLVTKSGWVQTAPPGGAHTVTVGSGQAAGPYPLGALKLPVATGTVFDDADRDGAQDSGESGLPGRVVYADLNRNGVRDLTTLSVSASSLPAPIFSTDFLTVNVPPQGQLVLADVNVSLDLTSRSIDLRLVSPTAIIDLMATFVGQPEDYNVTFDDEAAGPLPPAGAVGSYRPTEPLSAFDRTPFAGDWGLLVVSVQQGSPNTLRAWTFHFTFSEPFFPTDAQGRYSAGTLMPGAYDIRAEVGADRLQTSPPGGGFDLTLAASQEVSSLDFGAPRRALQVAASHVFYNNSAFDGRDPAAGPADDAAIAPDKTPLAGGDAGATPSAANLTSYAKGINGVMIDVHELPAAPTLADFSFKAPSSFNPAVWVDLPAPSGFAVRSLNDPADATRRRVSFIWPDNLLRNVWIQVSVLSNAANRRAAPAVFYVGNLVGKTGDATTPTRVSAADLTATRAAASRTRVTLSNRFDHNRDGVVNILDQQIVRGAIGHVLPALVPPASASAGGAPPARTGRPPSRTGWTAQLLDQ